MQVVRVANRSCAAAKAWLHRIIFGFLHWLLHRVLEAGPCRVQSTSGHVLLQQQALSGAAIGLLLLLTSFHALDLQVHCCNCNNAMALASIVIQIMACTDATCTELFASSNMLLMASHHLHTCPGLTPTSSILTVSCTCYRCFCCPEEFVCLFTGASNACQATVVNP